MSIDFSKMDAKLKSLAEKRIKTKVDERTIVAAEGIQDELIKLNGRLAMIAEQVMAKKR